LLDRRPEESCLGLLKENGIGVLARGSLANGLLAGKPAEAYLDHSAADVEAAALAVRALSGGHRSAAQTAVQFVVQEPAITSAVVGFRTIEQLDGIVKKEREILPLSKEDLNSLFGKINKKKYVLYR
jgi:aryl-alcohol dehydrogenase-like predicted oxidoreductase